MHARAVDTRPPPPPEGLGTRLAHYTLYNQAYLIYNSLSAKKCTPSKFPAIWYHYDKLHTRYRLWIQSIKLANQSMSMLW